MTLEIKGKEIQILPCNSWGKDFQSSKKIPEPEKSLETGKFLESVRRVVSKKHTEEAEIKKPSKVEKVKVEESTERKPKCEDCTATTSFDMPRECWKKLLAGKLECPKGFF